MRCEGYLLPLTSSLIVKYKLLLVAVDTSIGLSPYNGVAARLGHTAHLCGFAQDFLHVVVVGKGNLFKRLSSLSIVTTVIKDFELRSGIFYTI